MTFIGVFTAFAICVIIPASLRADVVTDWNARTVQYSAAAGRPGPSFVVDIAVVQAAVYDAVQAIEGDYQPYCGSIPGASGSVVAAAATAARDVLVNRFPAQAAAINLDYNAYMAGIDPADPGIAVGHTAANCVITLRTGDGSFPLLFPAFNGGTLPGEWRPTPPGNASMTAPWLGSVTPFTMRSNDQFRAGPPPDLASPEYTRAYNEVKDYGSASNSLRSDDQTDLAHFWNLSYPAVMNKLARDLAVAHVDSVSESSRLFALVDLAVADAVITAWADKLHYNFWRPVTAIRLGEDDGNPKTDADGTWTPLVVTPPYPDYTSGANNLAGSATRALSLFFGTNEMDFTITTTNTGPTVDDTRGFSSFSEVRNEIVEARILEGIHFRFADSAARKQGEHIAQWAHAHYFRPVE